MKKENTILLLLLLFTLYSFTNAKKLKGSIIIEPLDKGEYLPDNYNDPNYQE